MMFSYPTAVNECEGNKEIFEPFFLIVRREKTPERVSGVRWAVISPSLCLNQIG